MLPLDLRHVTFASPADDKQQVLAPWSGDYRWATESRLEQPWGRERYGIVGAFLDGACVGTTSYTVSARGQGILCQVFTDPAHRGRGIAKETVAAALQAFRELGARAVYLGAWEEWIRNIYRKVGFRLVGTMGERHAFKLTLQPSGEDDVLFRAGQATHLRPMAQDDQCDLTALVNAAHGVTVKHREFDCYLGSHFEGEFYALSRLERDGLDTLVLDGDETILGFATIVPSARRHRQHAGVIDLVVHPRYRSESAAMLRTLEARSSLVRLEAAADPADEHVCRLLRESGYRAVGVSSQALRIGGESHDLITFEKILR